MRALAARYGFPVSGRAFESRVVNSYGDVVTSAAVEGNTDVLIGNQAFRKRKKSIEGLYFSSFENSRMN